MTHVPVVSRGSSPEHEFPTAPVPIDLAAGRQNTLGMDQSHLNFDEHARYLQTLIEATLGKVTPESPAGGAPHRFSPVEFGDADSVLRPDAVIPAPRWEDTARISPIRLSGSLYPDVEQPAESAEQNESKVTNPTATTIAALRLDLENALVEKKQIELTSREWVEDAHGTARAVVELAAGKHKEIMQAAQARAAAREQTAKTDSEAHKTVENDKAQGIESSAELQNLNTESLFKEVLGNPEKFRQDVVHDLARLNQPGKAEQHAKQAVRKAGVIRDKARVEAIAILAAARVENDRDMQDAWARAERIVSEENARASRIVFEASQRVEAARAIADQLIAELSERIEQLSSPKRNLTQTEVTVQDVKTPEPEVSTMRSPQAERRRSPPIAKGGRLRKTTVGVIIAGVITGGGTVFAQSEGNAKLSQQQIERAAEDAVKLPEWENMPAAEKAWQEEWMRAISDPRAFVDGNNYLVGNKTPENPGRVYLLETLALLLSNGNPHYAGGLVPLATVRAREISQKIDVPYKLEHTGDPNPGNNYSVTPKDAQNLMIIVANNANTVINDMMKDSNLRKASQDKPEVFDAEFVNRWLVNGNPDPQTNVPVAIPVTQLFPTFGEVFINVTSQWRGGTKSSAQLDALLQKPKWVDGFKAAEQAVRDDKILSTAEENS